MHRLILMAYAGLAIGWIVNGALSHAYARARATRALYGLTVTLAPLGVAMLLSLGLRYLFSLPVTLQANWLFRTTGREGRRAWMAAVERWSSGSASLPVFAASLPAAIAVLGPVRGPAVTSLGLLAALSWFERIFRDWRKLPFTCSYLPGKTPAWMLMLRLGIAAPLLGVAGHLMLRSSANLIPFAALFTFELVVWRLAPRHAARCMGQREAPVRGDRRSPGDVARPPARIGDRALQRRPCRRYVRLRWSLRAASSRSPGARRSRTTGATRACSSRPSSRTSATACG